MQLIDADKFMAALEQLDYLVQTEVLENAIAAGIMDREKSNRP